MRLIRNFRPDGHAYFSDSRNRIAIADCSGKTPEDTDDGVLYIDRIEGIKFHGAGIALNLNEGMTSINTAEAQFLVYDCGVACRVGDIPLAVKR